MSRSKNLLGWAAALCVVLAGCTESEVYQWKTIPFQANKLALSGTVCSDDLQQANFPLKILFVVDVSAAINHTANDSNYKRAKAIEKILQIHGKSPNYYFGITIFGSRAANLLTDSTGQNAVGFTRDSTKLQNAYQTIMSGGGAHSSLSICQSGRCRDLRAALSLASSIVSGDILSSDVGDVARTTYAIILLTSGPPVPALGRCACRNKTDEQGTGKWVKCPWSECDCSVNCPANTYCKGSSCYPECSSTKGVSGCDTDEYCDPVATPWACTDGSPTSLPTVTALPGPPPTIADTYTHYIPVPSASATSCPVSTCVYPTGHPNSCEEQLLVKDALEMKSFAEKSGVGQFQLHTIYLVDRATWVSPSPFVPPGPGTCAANKAADQSRTERLMNQISSSAGGGYQKVTSVTQLETAFLDVWQDIYSSQSALLAKELVVFNTNVLARANGIQPDTDADGLTDDIEAQHRTCLSDKDTDGDGISDYIEVKLARSPTKYNETTECADLIASYSYKETGEDPCNPALSKTWLRFKTDKDKDGLNVCEERLLGTDDSLYDSDADGLPDRVELLAGTNHMAMDQLSDRDLDGVVNREEVRGHTDPQTDDAQSMLDLAYRYNETNYGLLDVLSFSPPKTITGVTIKNVSKTTSTGTGNLRFKPGPPPTLAWQDPADIGSAGTYGPAVDITKPSKEGYKLTSCRRTSSGGCSSDSAMQYVTVLVDGSASYPKTALVESIQITSAKRNCVDFSVRNVTLMETGRDPVLKSKGNNTINVYFAQVPKKSKTGYGIFRIYSLRVLYSKGPPETRSPKSSEFTITNDDFYLDISK